MERRSLLAGLTLGLVSSVIVALGAHAQTLSSGRPLSPIIPPNVVAAPAVPAHDPLLLAFNPDLPILPLVASLPSQCLTGQMAMVVEPDGSTSVRACVTTSKTVTTASDVCVTWTTAPVYVCWVDPWQPTPPPSIPGVGTYTPPPDGRAALAARCQQLGGTFSIPGTHCPSGKVECAYPPSKRCTQFAPPNVTTSYTTGWKTVQLGS